MATTVLITGATSGIGLETARLLSKNGFDLILCGRREERLINLKEELSKFSNIKTLKFDVSNQKEVKRVLGGLDIVPDVLLNNAGNAHGLSAIQDGDIADWDAMIDINVKGLLYVSKAIIPSMIEKGGGHIINIGSIAGKEVYPNGNVYCASKYAVDAISQGMRIDLNKNGIRVSSINPGMVETEFAKVRFKGDEELAENAYKGYQPLKPQDIADIIHFIITRPKHVNIADLLVLSTDQASTTVFNKNL
ncbi:MAG: SDR family NAD(P)-dependent oxidoreductase [Cyclobacteriaceae bacterium]|nr:SDR family NAD(P)-dependent oxidoreductase [Cyclobacteriaceae bacterium]